jgi:hypothetical protein
MLQSMHVTFKESSFFSNPCLPTGQPWQDWSWANGCKLGSAMNVPGEQHPKRAVLLPKDENALEDPVRDSHLPPHSVRLKPLS